MDASILDEMRARLDEIESLANDAYDVSAGILNPGIVNLAPPNLPIQEVFGGGGGSLVAAWSVARRKVNGAEGWYVFHPAWHCGRTALIAESCASGSWSLLPSTVSKNATVYAVLEEEGTAEYDEETETLGETTWTAKRVYMTDQAIPNDSEPSRYAKGYRYRTVAIGVFSVDTSTNKTTWTQWHVGAIVEKPTTEGGSGGGEGLPDGTMIPGDLRIINSSGAVWLQQRKKIWRESEGAFEDAGDGYAVNVLRLDEALTAAVLTESFETGNINKKVVRRKLDWSQVTAETGTTIAPGVDAATTPKDGDAEVAKFEQSKLLETDGENLRYFNAYVLAPGDAIQWMSKQTVDFTVTVGYTEPEDQYSKGKLFHRPGSITVLGTEVTEEPDETLLETVVEEANDTSTYES